MIEVLEKADTGERKMTMEEAISLVELAMRVNGFERRNSNYGEPNCKHKYPTVFINFSGHVSCLEIEIHENGWTLVSRPDDTFRFSLDWMLDKREYDRCTGCLQELIEFVEKDSKRKKIPRLPTKAMQGDN